nr:hypothetical protein Iba_chr11eCG14090 [Ipomoea batatas]
MGKTWVANVNGSSILSLHQPNKSINLHNQEFKINEKHSRSFGFESRATGQSMAHRYTNE